MNYCRHICLLCLSLFCLVSQAIAGESLKLLFEIREPMAHRDARGKLAGLVVDPVNQAMKAADIPSIWVETPFKRQLSMVIANDDAVCAVGMFKNKERQKFAKFSQPILRDTERPSIMLAHRDFQPDKGLDLLKTLSLPSIKMLKKDHASYGSVIDELIERSKVAIVTTTAEAKNMAMMVAAKRADFIFVPEDEALAMIKQFGDDGKLHIFKPLGMPQGPERFLMCSHQVSDELIQRFNKALVKP